MSTLLEVEGLRFKVGSFLLDGISLKLFENKIVGLIGPNGSGKSTLLKGIAGLMPMRVGVTRSIEGTIRLRGQEFLPLSIQEKARKIVYQGADLTTDFPITVEEVVSLGQSSRANPRIHDEVEEALKECACLHLRTRQLQTLSGGERQLVALAQARVQGGEVLLLDETFSKMDLDHLSQMGRLLKSWTIGGKSILFVSHDINLTLEWADQMIVMNRGRKVIEGSPQLLLDQPILSDLYPDLFTFLGKNPATDKPHLFFR